MKRLFNVTVGKCGNAFLILGKEKKALLDTRTAYCVPKLVGNIKAVIDN